MLKRIKLSSLKPNPYRHFKTYEIQKEKVETLVESINTSGFWGETVIARPCKGGYELAFGHHRWKAAQKVLGKDAMAEISVRDLSNEEMLQMMARENNEIYASSAAQDIELVKAAIEAHANGEITLPGPKKGGHGAVNRSLHASDYIGINGSQATDDRSGFTRDGLCAFLGVASWRINETLGHLKQIKGGLTTAEDYQGLTPSQAQSMKTQVHLAKSEAGVAVARKVAKKIGDAIRSNKAVGGRVGDTPKPGKVTAQRIAAEAITKAKGRDPGLQKFLTALRTNRDDINKAQSGLRKLTARMVESGITALNGLEAGDLEWAIHLMKDAIAGFEAEFPLKQRGKTQLKLVGGSK